MDADGLRDMLAAQPGLLEQGLKIYAEKGKSAGVGYSTPVGDIDLLARDANGDLVVVMVAASGQASQLTDDLLQRMGWVRKQLCGKGESVRAIVLLEPPVEDLGFAAAALASSVTFKTYRVALRFDDVEV